MALRDFAYDTFAPLKGPPVYLVLVVTPLALLAEQAGMFGVPLLWILAGWIWTYAFLLVESLAEGHGVPVLSIERTNPWHEPRALLPPLIVAAVSTFAWQAPAGALHTVAVVTALVLAALLPASLALVAIGCEVHRILSPPALVQLAFALGARYVGLLVLAGVYAFALLALARVVPTAIVFGIAQLCLFSLAGLLGRSIFLKRDALGLDAAAAPERVQARSAAGTAREDDAFAARVYGLLRVKREDEAWALATDWLRRVPADPAPCRWLRDRALAWNEQRFAVRLDAELVARLVAARRLGEAVATVEACWSRGGTLASQSASDRKVLSAAATRMGHVETAARLEAATRSECDAE